MAENPDTDDTPLTAEEAEAAGMMAFDLGGPGDDAAPAEMKAEAGPAKDSEYRVLARKYRPATFKELIGQEAMVRTLSNAFAKSRIAHAFMMTGVRGVGKTTTARIIAKALNCVGPDGTGGPTISPCGQCEPCRSIAGDRNVDVLEMDAASRTGIDDIREIIEGARYVPVSTRYKVYIIDEVHMLSKQAFNGLLKTLEEPPPHVKFIFATTEVRKVPVTVLSRCQRFDLRRVGAAELTAHLSKITAAEGASADEGALRLIARAAEGSVRDSLSLLDQAIAHAQTAEDGGTVHVTEPAVRAMLGLIDRSLTFDMLRKVLTGEAPAALDQLNASYRDGADPIVILQDLLGAAHWVCKVKLVPAAADDPGLAEGERAAGKALAEALGIATLSRAWQVLLRGLQEAREAPDPLAAAEMVLIRLGFSSDLRTPDEILKLLGGTPEGGGGGAPPPSGGGQRADVPPQAASAVSGPSSGGPSGGGGSGGGARAQLAVVADVPAPGMPVPQAVPGPRPAEAVPAQPDIQDFESLVAATRAARQMRLTRELERHVHPVRFAPGAFEFRPAEGAPQGLAGEIRDFLKQWTGAVWTISVVSQGGAATLHEQAQAAEEKLMAEVRADPLVAAALAAFDGAVIQEVRPRAVQAAEDASGQDRGGPDTEVDEAEDAAAGTDAGADD